MIDRWDALVILALLGVSAGVIALGCGIVVQKKRESTTESLWAMLARLTVLAVACVWGLMWSGVFLVTSDAIWSITIGYRSRWLARAPADDRIIGYGGIAAIVLTMLLCAYSYRVGVNRVDSYSDKHIRAK